VTGLLSVGVTSDVVVAVPKIKAVKIIPVTDKRVVKRFGFLIF